MPMRGRSRRQRPSCCCCSTIQCASRSLTGASTTVCMQVCLSKTIRASLLPGTSKNKGLQSTHERYPLYSLHSHYSNCETSVTVGSSYSTRTNVLDNYAKNLRFCAELLRDIDRIFSSQQPHRDVARDVLE